MKSITPLNPLICGIVAHFSKPAVSTKADPIFIETDRSAGRLRQLLNAFCLSLFVWTVAGQASASIIYFDDFSGSSGSNLHATAPDIRPGSQIWSSNTQWKADGSIGGTFGNPAHSYLPFAPSAGNVYALSVDMNVTGGQSANHFFSLGFSSTSNVSEAYHPDGFYAFMIKRTNSNGGSDDVETYLGPGATSGTAHNYDSGAVNLKVVLNTQPTLWTVEWFINNLSIRGPVGFSSSNPAISYVAFGSFQNTSGTADNFTLSLVPEPASLLMIASAAAACLIAYGRHRGHK